MVQFLRNGTQKTRISHSDLLCEVSYDKETGLFTRLRTASSTATVGSVCGWLHVSGYRYISLRNIAYWSASLAFFYVTKEWPSQEIDHIDNNKSNDTWSNLRLATHQQNMANVRARIDNALGQKGIRLHRGKYEVRIGNGGSYHVGTFSELNDAIEARNTAGRKHYGEFARYD